MSSAALAIPSGALSTIKRDLSTQIERGMASRRAQLATAVREVAGETAVALAERTFPSALAIGYAVRAVRQDVSSVYATPGRIYSILDATSPAAAPRFWSAVKDGDLARATAAVRSSGSSVSGIRIGGSLDPSLHERSRNSSNGRVEIAHPLQMCSKDEIAAYTREVVAQLGKTASGWAAAASDLGADGNSTKWKGTSVHGTSGGTTRAAITATSVTITLVNKRHLARKHISPGQVARILRDSRASLLDKLSAR